MTETLQALRQQHPGLCFERIQSVRLNHDPDMRGICRRCGLSADRLRPVLARSAVDAGAVRE